MSPKCPEMQKKIWGGLALGQIGKLGAATKQAAVSRPYKYTPAWLRIKTLSGPETTTDQIHTVASRVTTTAQDYKDLRQGSAASGIHSGSSPWTRVSCGKRRMGAMAYKAGVTAKIKGLEGSFRNYWITSQKSTYDRQSLPICRSSVE